jgi:hypothetical protein
MVLPLLPIAIGAVAGLAAYGLRKLSEGPPRPAFDIPTVSIKHNAFGPDGPGALLSFAVTPADADLGKLVLLVWPRLEGRHLKAKLAAYADRDGDLLVARPTEGSLPRDADGRPIVALFLPYTAIGAVAGEFELLVKLRIAGGVDVTESRFNVAMDSEKFDRQNLLSALCDAIVTAARASGELKREQVRYVRDWSENGLGLREPGLETVRRYLSRAAAESLDASADRAAFLGAVLKAELGSEGWGEVVGRVVDGVKAGGPVGAPSLRFVRWLASAMGAEASALDAALQPHVDEIEGLYATLGIAAGSSRAEVQRAYRQLIKECHPDLFHSAPEDERAHAEARARELNHAYERLLVIVA